MTRGTYKTVSARYLDALAGSKSARTVGNYELALRKLSDHLEQTGSERIDPLGITSFKTAMTKSGVSRNSIRAYLTALHAFFAWCVRMGLEQNNPVAKDEIPKEEQTDQPLPTADDIEKIIREAQSSIERAQITISKNGSLTRGRSALRGDCIMILLLQSGLRSSELRALTPADLNFERGTIRVSHGKGNKYREVPFPSLSRTAMKIYLEQIRPADLDKDQPLIGSTANESGHGGDEWHSLSTVALNGIVKRYMKSRTGKDLHTHSMRHAAASYWDDLGVPIRDVQNALGHSSVTTTERVYVKVLHKDKSAMNINAAFDNI